MRKGILFLIASFILFSCQKSDPIANGERGDVPVHQPPPVIQGLKTAKNYNGYDIYVEAALQEVNKPTVHPFYFLEAEFVFKLHDVFITITGKDIRIDISGGIAYTNKDYTALKVYMLKHLSVNGKNYSKKEMKDKKFVVFFDNGKLIYSLEQK